MFIVKIERGGSGCGCCWKTFSLCSMFFLSVNGRYVYLRLRYSKKSGHLVETVTDLRMFHLRTVTEVSNSLLMALHLGRCVSHSFLSELTRLSIGGRAPDESTYTKCTACSVSGTLYTSGHNSNAFLFIKVASTGDKGREARASIAGAGAGICCRFCNVGNVGKF